MRDRRADAQREKKKQLTAKMKGGREGQTNKKYNDAPARTRIYKTGAEGRVPLAQCSVCR